MKAVFLQVALISLLTFVTISVHAASTESAPKSDTQTESQKHLGDSNEENQSFRRKIQSPKIVPGDPKIGSPSTPVETTSLPAVNPGFFTPNTSQTASTPGLSQPDLPNFHPAFVLPTVTLLPSRSSRMNVRHLGANAPVVGGSAKPSCSGAKAQTPGTLGINGTGMSHKH